MNPINNHVQTSPAPWKKAATLTLGLGLLLGGLNTQAATDCNAVTEISTVECESLLELYHSTNGAQWENNDGWNVTNTPCRWYGVTCENGGVTAISLSDNQLTGAIPDFSALPKLQKLELSNNQLTGAIPDFSALTKLRYLDLRNNPICKDTNINYASWPIKQAKDWYAENEVEATWQEELDGFPNCPVNPPPTSVLTVWPPQGMALLTIELDASPSEGSIAQYAWTINGQTFSGQTNSTTLTEAGEYSIVLTVTDPDGQTAGAQQRVCPKPLPN